MTPLNITSQAGGKNLQLANAGNNPTQRGRPQQFQQQGPQLNLQFLQLLIQLIQLILQAISQPKPPPQPESLQLSQSQQDNLKELLGVNPNAPFGVQVLDNDGNGTLSAGDTAIVNGGITGGEIERKVLTDADIAQINTPKGNLPADFTANQQKWQDSIPLIQNIPPENQGVSYTTQQTCFCPTEFTRPMNITELNGQIVFATYADTGEAVPDNVRQSLQTIDQRFDQLKNAYETGADTVNATYDPQFGYPTSVFIDQSQQIADEEVQFTISNLTGVVRQPSTPSLSTPETLTKLHQAVYGDTAFVGAAPPIFDNVLDSDGNGVISAGDTVQGRAFDFGNGGHTNSFALTLTQEQAQRFHNL